MILYKFLSPDRVDVIEKLRIRFTQAPFLNDPYETNPVVGPSELSNEDWERITAIETKRNGLDPDEFAFMNDPDYRKELWPETMLLMRKLFSYRSGILSLTETNDNALMWAHYCYNHQGYVLGLNTDHAFFHGNQKEFAVEKLSRIVYTSERPNAAFEKLKMKDWYFTKSDEWAYEKEWRLVKNIENAETTLLNDEVALFDLPREIVHSIYLGAATSLETEEKIINALNALDLHIPVYKMMLNTKNYKIEPISYGEWREYRHAQVNNDSQRRVDQIFQLILKGDSA